MDTRTDREGPRILLGQHDPRVARELRACLEATGYRVASVVADGDRLLDVARRLTPDVSLVDVRLPGSIDAVEAGTALGESLEIPVLFLADDVGDRHTARARAVGAHACVTRPWERSLCPAIEMALHRHGMQRTLALSERRFRLLFEANPAGVVVEGSLGTILAANPAFSRSLGFRSPEELRGRPLRELVVEEEAPEGGAAPGDAELRSASEGREVRLRRQDGTLLWAVDSEASFADPVTGAPQVLHTFLDISERKELEERLARLAYHDALTGLPNRRLLELRGGQALAEARRRGDHAAVAFLDLVGFKSINDQMGHHAGDTVLATVADRLRASLRANDNVARFGGDEFVVVLSGVKGAEGARAAVERLLARVATPVPDSDPSVTARARAGVALFPDHAADLGSLMERADQALGRAKEIGGSVVVIADQGGTEAG